MLLKKYTFKQIFVHEDGWRRETEYVTGTLEELQQDIMMEKLAGTLGGYHIYNYDSKEEYINTNHTQWKEHEDHLVEQWFDKAAMVDRSISWGKNI